jgi:hypothetical protein
MSTRSSYRNVKNIGLLLLVVFFFNNFYAAAQEKKIIKKPASSNKKIPVGQQKGFTTTLTNFDEGGGQVTRFGTLGEAIDAHDGEIAFFDGVYYLYGTSYACGFAWQNKTAPFCGFKTYSSTDMVNWTDRGFLFDAATPVWQSRCNGGTYGCFRPHVIYNKKTGLFVLWINVYDNRVGFRVFTSKSPVNGFSEVAEPRLAVNSDSAVAGLNNGDHDTFVDDDGTGYIAYTDWRKKGRIVIDKLTDDYLSGTGEHVQDITPGRTEAPALFKRNGIYYLTYSDPNCGYCSGTGTSYRTAKSPLGPWSEGIKISNNSCGGQPSFVSPILLSSGMIYLYGSDLWNNGARNEALANYYWAPLSFAEDGSINKMECQGAVTLALATGSPAKIKAKKDLDVSTGTSGFKKSCDINNTTQYSQAFVAKRSGKLNKILVTSFQNGYPDAEMKVEVFNADQLFLPVGNPLKVVSVSTDSLSWAAGNVAVYPALNVQSGKTYAFVIKTSSSKGCYGLEYKDKSLYPGGGMAVSKNNGASFTAQPDKMIKFETFIR